jgi:hypothetical protein
VQIKFLHLLSNFQINTLIYLLRKLGWNRWSIAALDGSTKKVDSFSKKWDLSLCAATEKSQHPQKNFKSSIPLDPSRQLHGVFLLIH